MGSRCVSLLLNESIRDCKAIGGWKGAEAALEAAGVPADAPGVVLGDDGTATLEEVGALLAAQRVRERFANGIMRCVPPRAV